MAEIKETSKIPTSCTQTESTVLPCTLEKAWALFRDLAFDKVAPGLVKSTAYEAGATASAVGSVLKISYQDGSVWRLRVTEFSERHHTIAYELVEADPAVTSTSVQGELSLVNVTSDNTTFLKWTTEFSNDADLAVISDQKCRYNEREREERVVSVIILCVRNSRFLRALLCVCLLACSCRRCCIFWHSVMLLGFLE